MMIVEMTVDKFPNPVSIGHFLKMETENLHREVEGQLSKVLFHRNLNAQQYWQVLRCMQAAYVTMESALMGHTPASELLKSRSKLAWLENDIASISRGNDCARSLSIPELKVSLATSAQAMGLLYVMEGATLGGEHIHARLQKHGWLDSQQGVSFFLSYGTARMERWREFSSVLQAYYEQNPAAHNNIKEGAELAFNCIGKSLELIE